MPEETRHYRSDAPVETKLYETRSVCPICGHFRNSNKHKYAKPSCGVVMQGKLAKKKSSE